MTLPQVFYSEFAFSRTMEIILFFIVNIANFAYAYIITSTLLTVFRHKTTFAKTLSFVLITVLFQTVNVYVPYALTGFQGLGDWRYLLSTPNPLFSVLQFILCTKLLNMSKYKTIHMMLCLYLFGVLLLSLSRVINFAIFRQTGERYNYMIDAGSATAGALLNVVLYILLRRIFSKETLIIHVTDNVFVGSLKKSGANALFIEFLAYSCVIYAQLHKPYDSFSMLLVSLILLLAIAVALLRLMHKADQINLQNKAAHINTLDNVITDFRAVKHDFYNILSTYSGYISLDDLKGLKRYHEKLMSTTIAAGDQLDLIRKIDQNPALCALLVQKGEKAEKQNITMSVALHCAIDDIQMDGFDLCRVLANLLDNAMEAALEAESPHVGFSIEQKSNGDKLIVITNSVSGQVDIAQITSHGYTTKGNHSGIGLSQVREVISKYKNCGIHFMCYGGQFSAYIEIKGRGA